MNKNKINRRRAFRIYEQVDLFYQKINYVDDEEKIDFNNLIVDADQSLEKGDSSSNIASSFIHLLPGSHSQESVTLNINISTSGISFTSIEQLVPGDYLMIRVLMISSMTVIMTCCKVVYAKPSNPFEKKQYPYLIGAQFVNLKLEDKEILNRHIRSKKTRRMVLNGLAVSIILIVIQVPDLVFELIVDLFSFLFDNMVELAHLFYELIEYGLDQLIEHIFYTSVKDTQIIVFYIQIVLAMVLSYPLLKLVLAISQKLFFRCRVNYYRKKLSISYWWRHKTVLYKSIFLCIIIAVISCYGLFFI